MSVVIALLDPVLFCGPINNRMLWNQHFLAALDVAATWQHYASGNQNTYANLFGRLANHLDSVVAAARPSIEHDGFGICAHRATSLPLRQRWHWASAVIALASAVADIREVSSQTVIPQPGQPHDN